MLPEEDLRRVAVPHSAAAQGTQIRTALNLRGFFADQGAKPQESFVDFKVEQRLSGEKFRRKGVRGEI